MSREFNLRAFVMAGAFTLATTAAEAQEPPRLATHQVSFSRDAAVSPDGRWLYLDRGFRKFDVVDLETGVVTQQLRSSEINQVHSNDNTLGLSANGAIFGTDCTYGLSGGKVGETARFWRTDNFELIHEVAIGRIKNWPLFLAISPEGRYAAVAHRYEPSVVILDVEAGKMIKTIDAKKCYQCVFITEQTLVVTSVKTGASTSDSTVYLYEVPAIDKPRVRIECSKRPEVVGYSADAHQLALMMRESSKQRRIDYFDIATGKAVPGSFVLDEVISNTSQGHHSFSPQGTLLAISSNDRKAIAVYDVWKKERRFRVSVLESILEIVMNANGTRLVAAVGSTTWVWDLSVAP